MRTFDRYLLRLFLKVLLACFLSMTGLYIVLDTLSNLDEFVGYGRTQGGFLRVLSDYYSARVPWFFDHASGLLPLIAAMFALTWLQRTNELTALMAAGITTRRIVRPLLLAAVVISLLAVANRELLIPRVRDRLVRNAQDWLGERERQVTPINDNRTEILIMGKATVAKDQAIQAPSFTLYRKLGDFGRKLTAEVAYFREATDQHPRGYLLEGVSQPENVANLPTAMLNDEPVIMTPHDCDWLAPDQCFVASDVTFPHLASGGAWREFASTPELMAGLRNPSLDFGASSRVTVHSRFVQPLLDMTLLLMGLPLVLTRRNRNVFVAVGMCFGVVVAYFLVIMTCQGLGANGFLLTPAQAAWCPLIILVPVAATFSHPLWE